ncbi:P-loop containing nucleoside triphosphate hydrolase protein [Bombardia bombarda]|uniref:P-loop containing nucleoside triphosphate hydrolase protein n=1 Tax=Bombardia bombarda TaxID=252184 RepID=A0AA39WZN1_9PEZI|nr:P-loop containing nucleoside triphosphate hydrolase protein [Bombardia bombarda]
MNNSLAGCDDGAFGPIIHTCRQDFDFTLTFEQAIFSIAPSALLLLFAPIRIAVLRKRDLKVEGPRLRTAKVVSIVIFAILQLVQLVLWGSQQHVQGARQTALAASALSLVAALVLLPLSYMEHARSLKPSLLITAYLAVTVFLDIATIRTLWLSPSTNATIRAVLTSSFAFKVLLLVLEAVEKRKLFLEKYRSRSPEESSGIFSQALLWWLNRVIFFGARHVLTPRQLYPIAADMSSEKLSANFLAIWAKMERPQQHGKAQPPVKLKAVLFRLLWWPIMLPVLPRLALLAFTLCQPLMIRRLLEYLQDPVQTQDAKIGYGLVGACVIIYIGMAISAAVYWHRQYRFMAMVRGTLTTAVFRKASELPVTASNSAKTVTLMSADCERIGRGLMDLHELWANMSQVAIATYLIQTQLGVACVAPIAVTLLTTGLTAVAANYTPGFQARWIDKIQTRIAVTSSVLGSMKAIKVTNLTSKVSTLLNKLREEELAAAGNFRLLSIITSTIAFVPQFISPVITFAVFIAVARNNGTSLDVTRIFTSLTLLLLVAEPLFNFFIGLIDFMTALGGLKRIEEFLVTAPRIDKRLFSEAASQSPNDIDGEVIQHGSLPKGSPSLPCISVNGGNFGWSDDNQTTLRNLNFSVNRGQIVSVVGPVACGKSTLIKALLGETTFFEGNVTLTHHEISFCDQSPFIMNDTIRANITYASAYDSELYNTVIHSCDLASDIALLAKGDMTMVGSKGISLSTGQRQRLALARAVYSRKNITFLDDVFSQLDANTQLNIARRLLGPNGIFRRWGITVVMSTSSPRFLSYSDQIVALNASGEISQLGAFNDLKQADGYIRQILHAHPERDLEVIDIAVMEQNEPADTSVIINNNASEAKTKESHAAPSDSEEEAAVDIRASTDMSAYRYYFASINKKNAMVFLFFQVSLAFLSTFSYVWLKWWTDDSSVSFPNERTPYYIGVYAALQGGALVAFFFVSWWCLNILAVATGFKLHADLTKTVLSTLKLFGSTDIGSILNRFTQDIQLADMQLPLAFQVVITNLLVGIAQAGLIASASGWIALSYPFIAVAFYLIPTYYVRTARQIRALDLEEKAPVYAQFLETLEGMISIRAFSWVHASLQKNYELVDRSQKPFYLMYVIQKWLGLVIDLVIAALATLVVGLAVGPLRNTISPGFTGVSLTQIVSFTSYLKLLILFWAQLQTAMSAVDRIQRFGEETEKEDDEGNQAPSEDWPSHGHVMIEGLSAKYSDDSDDDTMILKDVNLDIIAGQKVCICGRTGSGKSSLILTLLRLLDPKTGCIKVDGVDLSSLPRHVVRSRLAGVAEDPFFFPGTVRENMDPYGLETDEAIVQGLADVGLMGVFDQVEGQGSGGLDAVLDKEMLSHGQRQLFNIAKAMLRGRKLLILDEVTSSLDAQAEQVVNHVIKTRLKQQTVISVIHNLDFALGFDKVVVMDRGRIIEFDTPQVLMARASKFRELYDSQRNTPLAS